jgi:hypothetical protein
MVRWEGSLILFALRLRWVPLITSSTLSNSRFSSGGTALCGDVQAVDLFAQSFLIRMDDRKVETVPHSSDARSSSVSNAVSERSRAWAISPNDQRSTQGPALNQFAKRAHDVPRLRCANGFSCAASLGSEARYFASTEGGGCLDSRLRWKQSK